MYIPGPNPVIPPRECNVRDSVKDLVRYPVARPRFSSVGNRGSKEKEYAFNPKLHVRK